LKQRHALVRVGLAFGALFTGTACAGFFGFEELVAENAGGGAAGSGDDSGVTGGNGGGAGGTTGSGGAPTSTACGSFGVPDPPTADAGKSGSGGAGGDAESYAVAVSEVDFGFTTAPDDVEKSTGLNLDKQCTDTREQVEVGCVNDNALGFKFDTYIKDKPNGVDNSGLALLKVIAGLYTELSPEDVNARLKEGDFGLVARVERYNGASDDTDVFVTVQPALGVHQEPVQTPPKYKVPNFNETDVWATDKEYYLSSEDEIYPTIKSQIAYVSGGRLVARFDVLYANIGMPNPAVGRSRPLEVYLEDAWFVGDLSIVDGQMSIHNGILAGRWPTTKVFESMRKNAAGTAQSPSLECVNDLGKNPIVRSTVCDAQDLGDVAGEPCNAISVGIGFTAKPASIDTFTTKPVNIDRQGTDGCDECSCDGCKPNLRRSTTP
jgi:hypothetical protein